MKKGQVIRITATTTVDFVFFKLQNLRERFTGHVRGGKPVDVLIYER